MRQIKLYHCNLSMLVDDADFEFLSRFSWTLKKSNQNYYAMAWVGGKKITAHQLICPSNTSLLSPDHKNGNGLDNQRQNLRLANQKQQVANSKKTLSKTSSKYKGVSFHKSTKKWRATIQDTHLGLFKSERRAATIYNEAAKEKFGEFAKLNILETLQWSA